MKILLFLLVFFSTCKKSESTLDNFCNSLEKTIEKKKILTFKNASKDSMTFYFKFFYADFLKVYKDSSNQKKLNNYFESINIGDREDFKIYYLCSVFHSKLNRKIFNTDTIINDYKYQILILNKPNQ